MDIAFRHIGQIKIDNVRDIIDINTARRDIGCDQQPQFTGFKVSQSALALRLAFIAMDGAGANAGFFEAFYHLVSAMLGARKHQSAVDRWVFHQLLQKHLLMGRINKNNLLLNTLGGCGYRRYFHPSRIAQKG